MDLQNTSTSADITPELAQKWLARFAYPGQRKLSLAHVSFLAELMKDGKFRYSSLRLTGYPFGQELNGDAKFRFFLTNGQHRLHAVVESGVTIRFGVEQVKVGSKAEVAADYAEQDNIRNRTWNDSFGALELSDKWDLAPRQLTRLQGATRIIFSDFALKPRTLKAFKSRNETARLMAPWAEPAKQFFETIADSLNASLLQQPTVMAPALATLKGVPDKASAFWAQIAADDGLKAGDPRRTLLYHLRQTETGERARLLLGVAQCWAAFCEERELHKCEFERDARFSLMGTLWERA